MTVSPISPPTVEAENQAAPRRASDQGPSPVSPRARKPASWGWAVYAVLILLAVIYIFPFLVNPRDVL